MPDMTPVKHSGQCPKCGAIESTGKGTTGNPVTKLTCMRCWYSWEAVTPQFVRVVPA